MLNYPGYKTIKKVANEKKTEIECELLRGKETVKSIVIVERYENWQICMIKQNSFESTSFSRSNE